MLVLFLLQVFCTFFMTGVIVFVQVVHYPLFSQVGQKSFPLYHHLHESKTAWVVVVPMLVELVAATVALALPAPMAFAEAVCGWVLVLFLWLSTFLIQIPQHKRLGEQMDAFVLRRLVLGNGLRTVAWSTRSLLLLSVLVRILG